MSSVEGEALRLIELVYAAVSEPAQWPCLLESLATAVKAQGGLLRKVDCDSGKVSFSETLGYDERFVRAYQDYYVRLDYYRDVLLSQPVGTLLTNDQVIDPEKRAASEYFNDYERPQDRIHVVGSALAREDSDLIYLGLHRGGASREFAARDIQLIRLVLPHLARAVQLQGLLAQSRDRQVLSETTLDQLRVAVMLTDADARPFFVNKAAETLLEQTRALTLGVNGLVLPRSTDNVRLHQMISSAAAVTAGTEMDGGGDLQLTGPDGKTLQVWVTPLSRPQLDHHLFAPAACAAVFVSRPGSVDLPWQRVATHYGLTPAEARLAVALVEGRCMEEAAQQLGVSIHTARSHLKAVFAKTETHRQPELVALLLCGVLGQCRSGKAKS